MKKQVIVKSVRGADMPCTASLFDAKGWIYLDFGKKSRICFDKQTLEIIKSQSHLQPVLAHGELARVAELF